MYSVVVLMALGGSAETADLGRMKNCGGCSASCSGCMMASHGCSSCGGRMGLLKKMRSKHCGGNGCSSSCGSCGGAVACHGCSSGCAVIHGCSSGCAVIHGGCAGGCSGGVIHMHVAPSTPKMMPAPEKKEEKKEEKKTSVDAPGTVVVNLPADAKLTVDDYATTSTSARRVFTTPNLTSGKTYTYTLKAEVVRDNTPQTVTREITVQAGTETAVTLEFTSTVAAR